MSAVFCSSTATLQHPPQPASPHSPFAFGPVPNIRIPILHGHHKLGVVLGWRTENHAVHPARAHTHQHTKRRMSCGCKLSGYMHIRHGG
jgi:hypothetical protein